MAPFDRKDWHGHSEIATNKKNWKFKLGLTLIIISIPLFIAIPLIPFMLKGGNMKLTITTVVLVSAEILFWGGGLLLGKELFAKYTAHLNPVNWFRQKEKSSEPMKDGDEMLSKEED